MGKILGNASKPYAKRSWRGRTFDNRTISAIKWAERNYIEVAPKKRRPWVVTQGSYNPGGVTASAGTHDGGGVWDCSVAGMNRKQIKAAVKWMRKAGFAAWFRDWPGNQHIHAVLRGHRTASPGAKAQVASYERHRDGLAGDNYDSTWRPKVKRRWSHRKNAPVLGK